MKHWIAAAIVAACMPAHALLSDVSGANYSFDSASGLYWLDVKETVGQSYNDVIAGSFVADGWRYATRSEVSALFSSNITQPAAGGEETTLATSLGGWTIESTGGAAKTWTLSGIYDAGSFRSLATLYTGSCGGCFGSRIGTASLADSVRDLFGPESGLTGGSGSFLVNTTITPVPEPGTFALLGLGLVGVLLAARRRSRPQRAP